MSSNVNPNHYKGFSNGSEVIDITENLTFNGGNAVKYLSRACRVDGNNKGLRGEDLQKALWYTMREIELVTGDTWDRKREQESIEAAAKQYDDDTVAGTRWLKFDDEYKLPDGVLLRDNFSGFSEHDSHRFLKQSYDASYLQYFYMPCNEFGEESETDEPAALDDIAVEFPITIVKAKEKK